MCDMKRTRIMEGKFALHKNRFNGRKQLKCLLITVIIILYTECLPHKCIRKRKQLHHSKSHDKQKNLDLDLCQEGTSLFYTNCQSWKIMSRGGNMNQSLIRNKILNTEYGYYPSITANYIFYKVNQHGK